MKNNDTFTCTGDGWTIMTNSKDQTIRVWDIRKMQSSRLNNNGKSDNCQFKNGKRKIGDTTNSDFDTNGMLTTEDVSTSHYHRDISNINDSTNDSDGLSSLTPSSTSWDYRWERRPASSHWRRGSESNPVNTLNNTCCVSLFHGHCVLQTLMRAHYSPRRTTGA